VAPARACAYRVIRRVFDQGAYADRALHAEAAGLDRRDRALATALAYGTVQRSGTLDHVIAVLSHRPAARLEAPVRDALRLGLQQILHMDGIAAHAAVSDSVELAKAAGRGAGGSKLVNAVLRRAVREGRAILEGLDDTTAAGAATAHSVPRWLAELWFDELGPERARALLGVVNQPAEAALRVNALRADAADLPARLGARTRPALGLPEGLVVEEPFDAHASAAFAAGEIMPQSRGSMLVARALAPAPGERVLDLCAAPGGKTTHLAALMAGTGTVRAVERHGGRAQALRRTAERLGAANVEVVEADAAAFDEPDGYDRVLVDPPCSGLGTLQSRPDLRWRATPERLRELAELQLRILRAAARAVRPGGVLVYSVCTISRREGEGVVSTLLESLNGWGARDLAPDHPWAAAAAQGPFLQLMPDREHTDGFFIARLERH
jgi:16S rRNA (cytosine967-C5)-methyltransferase